MSDFGRHLVYYSEYEAYRSNWRYQMEKTRQQNEAVLRWIHENKAVIDVVFTVAFFLYLGWFLLGCYRSRCAQVATEEAPMDKKRLRNELVNIEHAIAALNDHRTCIMLKLKRD